MLTRKERYQQERERRIEECLKEMSVDTDVAGKTYAIIHSQSKVNEFYNVEIDESGRVPVAVSCDCVGNAEYQKYCIHMEAIDRFFSRICCSVEMHEITETVASIDEATEEAIELAEQTAEEERKLDETYAQLANDPTDGIRAVLADREAHDAAGITSDCITASMNNPEKLAVQKDEITRERQRDLSERGNLSSNRGFSMFR